MPGSSSSFHVLEFMCVGPRLTRLDSFGDSGGDASKVDVVATDVRTGGGGKRPNERAARRLLLAVCSGVM
jgi:hypothetical protein